MSYIWIQNRLVSGDGRISNDGRSLPGNVWRMRWKLEMNENSNITSFIEEDEKVRNKSYLLCKCKQIQWSYIDKSHFG